jgi:hypothetical protein
VTQSTGDGVYQDRIMDVAQRKQRQDVRDLIDRQQAEKDYTREGVMKLGPQLGRTGGMRNFMSNLNPLRLAGSFIDNPFTRGIWGLATSPFKGGSNLNQWASNMRGGMSQREWEQARQARIANTRIQNILGRKAPITDMTLQNLRRLGHTGEMPGVGSTATSRAIDRDLAFDPNARISDTSFSTGQGIAGTDAYETFDDEVAGSKELANYLTNRDQFPAYDEYESNQLADQDFPSDEEIAEQRFVGIKDMSTKQIVVFKKLDLMDKMNQSGVGPPLTNEEKQELEKLRKLRNSRMISAEGNPIV